MNKKHYELYIKILNSLDEAYKYMEEYDSLPHKYGEEIMYQAESHLIQIIGNNPGITVTELAQINGKTTSANSQLVRKLRAKNWVEQTRNEKNNREYNLNLTKDGWNLYQSHESFDKECFDNNYKEITEFSEENLQIYLTIQEKINKAFKNDVETSKKNFEHIKKR